MKETYEIEIKSLLGSEENANRLLDALRQKDGHLKEVGENAQLNHYFVGGEREKIAGNIIPLLESDEEKARLRKILQEASNLSVRTRKANDDVLFVLKASIDDTTSENGTARVEFEARIEKTIDELDAILIESGCEVQAKWSRDRREYKMQNGTNICLDRNAGYGYLAEFERVVEDATEADRIKQELRALMADLGVEELPQDRLERMFTYYNENWKNYYGTDKTFEIK